jgi:hypothetical protein
LPILILSYMKYALNILTFVTFSLLTLPFASVQANNNPVTLMIEGVATPAVHLVAGEINLYVVYRTEVQMIPVNDFHYRTGTVESSTFFIGVGEQLEELKPSNYKKIIRRHLANAPYLHKHLGKPGFRYENIPYMIEFYNRFRT